MSKKQRIMSREELALREADRLAGNPSPPLSSPPDEGAEGEAPPAVSEPPSPARARTRPFASRCRFCGGTAHAFAWKGEVVGDMLETGMAVCGKHGERVRATGYQTISVDAVIANFLGGEVLS